MKNDLQVVPESKEKMVEAKDDQIEDKVQAALKTQGLTDVSVDAVNNGVVTLKGKTDTLAQQLTAIETAYKVPGVRRVASQVESAEK